MPRSARARPVRGSKSPFSRLRSPTICHLQTGGPGDLVLIALGGLRPRRRWGGDVPGGCNEQDPHFSLPPPSVLFRPPSMDGWSSPTLGRRSLFYWVQIQMLISSRNTLPDQPRIMYGQITFGHLMTQPSWHLCSMMSSSQKETLPVLCHLPSGCTGPSLGHPGSENHLLLKKHREGKDLSKAHKVRT